MKTKLWNRRLAPVITPFGTYALDHKVLDQATTSIVGATGLPRGEVRDRVAGIAMTMLGKTKPTAKKLVERFISTLSVK